MHTIDSFAMMEPMKYYNNENPSDKRTEMLNDKDYLYIATEKHDGDWGMFIHYSKGHNLIRSRSISKVTGIYGDYTEKVPHLVKEMDTWPDNTVVLGELCFKEYNNCNGVGTILRCLPAKAIERQKDNPLYVYVFDVLMVMGEDLTSDTHFNHLNIIKYCNRPFNDLNSMNLALVEQWNKTVGENDLVLFLGDFCFAKNVSAQAITHLFATALNGNKIIVKGNHDYRNFRYVTAGFIAESYQELTLFDRFLFVHRPDDLRHWHEQFDFVFYGHIHNQTLFESYPNTINVCLDANNFTPLDITNYFTDKELAELTEKYGGALCS